MKALKEVFDMTLANIVYHQKEYLAFSCIRISMAIPNRHLMSLLASDYIGNKIGVGNKGNCIDIYYPSEPMLAFVAKTKWQTASAIDSNLRTIGKQMRYASRGHLGEVMAQVLFIMIADLFPSNSLPQINLEEMKFGNVIPSICGSDFVDNEDSSGANSLFNTLHKICQISQRQVTLTGN